MWSVYGTLAASLASQVAAVDTVAGNLAHLATPGYRARRTLPRQLGPQPLELARDRAGRPEPAPVLDGAAPATAQELPAPGPLERTDRPLDVVATGGAFLALRSPDGTLVYRRSDTLAAAPGRLTSPEGWLVALDGALPADATPTRILPDGRLVVRTPAGAEEPLETRLALARFANPDGLGRVGPRAWAPTARSGPAEPLAPGDGAVLSGVLERANVDVGQELTTLLAAHRAYGLALRALEAVDGAIDRLVGQR